MKTFKKYPRKQLEKFSTIFMQLGIVLALFIVYVSLEHQTSLKNSEQAYLYTPISDDVVYDMNDTPTIVRRKVEVKTANVKQVEPTPPAITDLSKLKKDNNENSIEAVISEPTEPEPKPFNIDSIVEEVPEEDPIVEDVPYTFVQNKPIFAGCEDLDKQEQVKCFSKKINKIVQKYFDADLANELGLSSGKYRIATQFVIDQKGNVTDVNIRAPHPKLKKEVQGVVSKIPKFTPGMQNKKPVKVKYTLPITFKVD